MGVRLSVREGEGGAESYDLHPGWRLVHTLLISAGRESKFTSAWVLSSLCCQRFFNLYRHVLNVCICKDRIFRICFHVIHAWRGVGGS